MTDVGCVCRRPQHHQNAVREHTMNDAPGMIRVRVAALYATIVIAVMWIAVIPYLVARDGAHPAYLITLAGCAYALWVSLRAKRNRGVRLRHLAHPEDLL